MKPFILIAGMHRSGTSFLARALNLGGVFLGDLDSLISHEWRYQQDNLRGHWENKQFLDLGEKTLELNNGSWDKIPEKINIDEKLGKTIEKTIQDLAGFPSLASGYKDPRILLYFDAWKKYFPENTIIIGIFRDPLKVAESLKIRNNFPYEKSLDLLKIYNDNLISILEHQKGFLLNFDWPKEKLLSELALIFEKIGLTKIDLSDWYSGELLKSNKTFQSTYALPDYIEKLYTKLVQRAEQNSNVKIEKAEKNTSY